ncbi:hypothetical protein PFISCL1PPCAC_1224 [Pristionchus fissidentatus]|uniref:Transmembrane protein n=1 Tax=Pristionchus fissidentatus TaxID=1538716 RepID=A0AAV5UUF7_9BILA|nr:hypothetical protein PFISCL1PPCAC_1224 [Pristionchus fissidentatus]
MRTTLRVDFSLNDHLKWSILYCFSCKLRSLIFRYFPNPLTHSPRNSRYGISSPFSSTFIVFLLLSISFFFSASAYTRDIILLSLP